MDLNNLNIDFADKKVQQIIAIILVGIIASGLIYWFMIKVNTEELNNLKAKRDSKQLELNKVRQLEPQLVDIKKTVSELKVKLSELEEKFPSSVNTPQLISSITKMAHDNKLYVINFKPLPQIEKEYYIEHSYELELVGPYHKIGEFFQDLADYELIINISGLSLKASNVLQKDISDYASIDHQGKRYDDRINSIDAKFKISTYSSKNKSGAKE